MSGSHFDISDQTGGRVQKKESFVSFPGISVFRLLGLTDEALTNIICFGIFDDSANTLPSH